MPPKKKILTSLDKPFQTAREIINPEEKKARLAEEKRQQRARISALPPQITQQPSPPLATTPPSPAIERPAQIEIIRNQDTGKISGVKFPDGRIQLGSEKDIIGLIESRQKKSLLPVVEAAAEAKKRQIQEQQQQNLLLQQQAISQLGQQVPPSAELDTGDFLTTAALSIPTIAAGISGGAGLGALAGTAAGPVGTVAGGITFGIIGGITSFFTKLTVDKRQAVREADKVFRLASSTRNTQLLNLANSGTVPPADIVLAYNQNLANIKFSRDKLKEQTKGKIGKQLSGAMDELIAVEDYLENEPFYRAQLVAAIQNPNPNLVYPISDETENLNKELS